MTTQIRHVDLDVLSRKSYCIFINEHTAEKLSGGFYDQNYIHAITSRKFDEYFAITYLLEGRCKYTDYLGQTVMVLPGSILIRHAGTEFTSTVCYDERNRWLEFSAALPMSFFNAIRAANILTPEMTLITPGINIQLIKLAQDYIASLQTADTAIGCCQVYGLFLKFFSVALQLAHDYEHPDALKDEDMIRQAKLLLEENFDRNFSMRMVAKELNLGYESFRKKFVQHCGFSPNEYRIRKRIDKADSLLMHTRMSIKEIAVLLGYSAVSSFTRQYTEFRKHPPTLSR